MQSFFTQAIVTKFHGATDRRGSRVSARCDAGRISLTWDHRLNCEENHKTAATALAAKLGWDKTEYYGEMVGGGLPGGGYCFVFTGKR